MTPGKFLRMLWGDEGFYCIAHPWLPPGATEVAWYHKVFKTITEAVTHVHEVRERPKADVYFAILTLEQEKVWNPEKFNHQTKQKGAYSHRIAENMLASKALFFDIDVGVGATKYPTQAEALAALESFRAKVKLPLPTIVSSGGGLHVYWHFDAAIPRDEWRRMAWHMRKLAEHLGLKVDESRTIDASSVLRVPDTFNYKKPDERREVKALQEGAVSSVAALKRIISDTMIANGVLADDPPKPGIKQSVAADNPFGVQQGFEDFGPPPTFEEVGDACAQMREVYLSGARPDHPHYRALSNDAWYKGVVGLVRHCENGDDVVRQLTAMHPRDRANVEDKLNQQAPFAPARCATIASHMPWGDKPCQGCMWKDKVANPLIAARKTTLAAPPIPEAQPAALPPPIPGLVAPSIALLAAMIPNPPHPFERLKTGEIVLNRKDKDGNDTKIHILHHDLYPLKRVRNEDARKEQTVWRAILPRSGATDFVLDADALYDQRKFMVAIANSGIYPNKAEISALQDYMVAYISQLQKQLDAEKQATHLGWIDEFNGFVLPDKTIMADGSVRVSSLSDGARSSSSFMGKKGTFEKQQELLRFFEHDSYLPNQFTIMSSLASILYYMTGHAGVVVNCSGAPGASKSTSAYTGASFWGHPKSWGMSGTASGATEKGRVQRIFTNANLPTIVDEITHMHPKLATELVMHITQPGHRVRLNSDGTEQNTPDNYKSAIMITTANSSLHGLLSVDNAGGTAGSMRVFEMKFVPQFVHSKAEADEYLRQLEENYGHIGERFAAIVIQNRKAIERRVHKMIQQIDEAAGIQASERFWSAVIAVVIVTAEICQHQGWLNYDPEKLLKWAVETQIPYMRNVVRDEYRDPLAVLSDYIAERHANIVIVERSGPIGANTTGQAQTGAGAFAVNQVHGALLGHYENKQGVLYLLKQGFKDHCTRIGANCQRIIEDLAANGPSKVIIERRVRRTLGAGTPFAKGQAWCFAVDMNHPELSGAVPLQTVQGGAQAAPAVPAAPPVPLKVVK